MVGARLFLCVGLLSDIVKEKSEIEIGYIFLATYLPEAVVDRGTPELSKSEANPDASLSVAFHSVDKVGFYGNDSDAGKAEAVKVPGAEGEKPRSVSSTESTGTYLDAGVKKSTSIFGQVVLGESEEASRSHVEVEKYSKMFLQAAPLFIGRKVGLSMTLGMFGLDQARPEDSLGTQTADFALGATKGAALRGTMQALSALNASPAMKGVAMGVTDRTVQTALTRESWVDPVTGEASLSAGIGSTFMTAADPRAMGMDALLFGVTEFTIGRLNYATAGALYRHPALPVMASGGVFGMGSGAGEEIIRQRREKEEFDFSKVLYRAGMAGGVSALAAGVGGLDKARSLKIQGLENRTSSDTKMPVPERVAKFNELDSRQLELKSAPLKVTEQLNHVAYMAEINVSGGSKKVLFRLTETPDMKARFANELLDYQLHRALKPGTDSRAVAPVEAMINGQKRQGYVQELSGRSFEDGLRDRAAQQYNLLTDRAAARVLRNDPYLKSQYEKLWAERMLMAEWDNHGHNMLMGAGGRLSNIDFAKALPSAKYVTDYVPTWGKTASRVSLLNDRLVGSFSGKPLSADTRDMMTQFVKDFDTGAGRQALAAAGHSPRQVDGLLGRARWFSENGTMPVQDVPNYFVQASLRALYWLRRGHSHRFEQDGETTR